MIFDELSNVYFCFVLQRLGVELDGGGASRHPAADHGSFGALARRGLSQQGKELGWVHKSQSQIIQMPSPTRYGVILLTIA